MTTVIKVENLSKKYVIGHQDGDPRKSLAESITKGARALVNAVSRAGGHSKEEFWALNDVCLDIKDGERVGIIGKNGAGKSTLLKVMSRITEPTAGRVSIKGRVASLLEVGTGFHPELTGRENIYLNGSIMGMSREEIKGKFDEIVDFSGVEKFLDTPIKRYSSGMKVRLAFAVAAHLEPEILLVDEVLAVGDYEFQRKSLGKMEDVSRQGRTIIFVSHNMPAITSLCTRAVMLEKGSVAKDGDPVSVVAHYYTGGVESPASADLTTAKELPGDDVARMLRASARNSSGEVAHEIPIEEPFTVDVEYEVLKDGAPVSVAVSFTHDDDTLAFWSSDIVEDKDNTARARAGVYKSTMRVPASLLNSGTYYLSVNLYNPASIKSGRHCVMTNLLQIHVVDPIYGVKTRGKYVGPYLGAVRPLLDWGVEKVS
ncbi:MAG: ABC transporter ATP-binding protein [Nitrospinae bacterium]|nr:ABC transporter ATP-binding protein [Nitrospinota bacterium]